MKKKKAIAHKNMPVRYPVYYTLLLILCLDYWNAPEWLWGAVSVFIVTLWGLSIWARNQQEEVDIFEDKDKNQDK